MKSQLIYFVIFLIFYSGMVLNTKYKLKQEGGHQVETRTNSKTNQPHIVGAPKHVSEIIGSIDSAKDNSKLWKDFEGNSYNKVVYAGVHGSKSWKPAAEDTKENNGFNKIASPQAPKEKKEETRIIANDLPGKTMSASSFDLPKRSDVLQINIPDSTTKITTMSYQASNAEKIPNLRPLLHGIETVGERVYHGRFVEIEDEDKSNKKNKFSPLNKASDEIVKVSHDLSEDALSTAKKVEVAAGQLAKKIKPDPTNLVISIETVNKKENNKLAFPLK